MHTCMCFFLLSLYVYCVMHMQYACHRGCIYRPRTVMHMLAMQNVMNRVDNHFGLFDMALNWTHNV